MLTFALLAVWHLANGQEVKPSGSFLSDSTKIGEELLYSLSVSYPEDWDVVFPDSLYDFSPFEINAKDYFFTKTEKGISFDSAVYNISTFEIDSVQYLGLPIFILQDGDSLRLAASRDSIVLNHVVTQIPDSLALLDNTVFRNVPLQFNYPYLVFGLSTFIIILIIVLLVFGKQLQRKYLLYKLKKAHGKFVLRFQGILSQPEYHFEHTLLEWKKYMERLEKWPYTKLTTKEIASLNEDKFVVKALMEIDKAIYSTRAADKVEDRFSDLLSYCDQRYNSRVEQIKYGTSN